MNYWIFKANPEKYDLNRRLLDADPKIVWAVTRYQDRIQSGDTVFIWRAGTLPGICAVMEIEINPYEPEQQEIQDGFVVPVENIAPINSISWAKCCLTQRFPIIEASVIKKLPGLELFSFFSAFPRATNFSITRPEGAILLEFIEKYLAEGPARKNNPVRKPAAKIRLSEPGRTSQAGKAKSKQPGNTPVEFELLKCETCGRYVVRSDTDRHTREVHADQPVQWKQIAK
jgi:hypothetical protein